MTDLAPLKLLAAGGSGGEKTYQYPEEVYCSELASGGQMNFPGVTVSGTVTTSNTNPYSTSYDIAGYYSWIFNGTGSITLPQSTDHMNDLTGGGFFICFWMKTDVYSQESSEDRTIFVQDIGTGSNYADKLKIGITSAQKMVHLLLPPRLVYVMMLGILLMYAGNKVLRQYVYLSMETQMVRLQILQRLEQLMSMPTDRNLL